jgi:hypothetical protein
MEHCPSRLTIFMEHCPSRLTKFMEHCPSWVPLMVVQLLKKCPHVMDPHPPSNIHYLAYNSLTQYLILIYSAHSFLLP